MMLPGEDGLVMALVCISILLVGFSIVSFGRVLDTELSSKVLLYRADSIADAAVKGKLQAGLENAHVRIGEKEFGSEFLGGRSVVVRRVFFDGSVKTIEVRVW